MSRQKKLLSDLGEGLCLYSVGMTTFTSQIPAYRRLFAVIAAALLPVTLIASPASATGNPLTTPPTLAIDSAGVITTVPGVWSTNAIPITQSIFACRVAVLKPDALRPISDFGTVITSSDCNPLTATGGAVPTNLFSANESGSPFVPGGTRNFIIYVEQDTSNQQIVWTDSVEFGAQAAAAPAGPSQFSQAQMDPGVSYAGPTISGISKRIMSSDGAEGMVLRGSRLNLITLVTVDGMPGFTDFTLIDGFPLVDFKKQRGVRFVEPIPAGTYEVVVTTKGHGTIRFKVTFS